jgi:hypothetical protein
MFACSIRARPDSAVCHSLQLFGIASSLHGDLRCSTLDLVDILRAQIDVGCTDVLLHASQLRGAGNWNNPGLLSQQPRERDSSRCRLLTFCDSGDQLDQRLICFPRLRQKAGDTVSQICAGEYRFLVDCSGEETFSQWAIGNEADPEFLEGWQDFGFRTSPPERIFALKPGDALALSVRTKPQFITFRV